MKIKPLKIIITILLIAPCLALKGAPEESFFAIGWSEKGDVFAYGYFEHYPNPSYASSEVVIRIQSMVTDEILFRYSKRWEETFRGDELDVYPPQTKEKAWQQVSGILKEELDKYNIKEGTYPLNKFFPEEDWNFNALVRPFEMEPGYEVLIRYLDGSEKTISSTSEFLVEGNKENMICGFIWNPKKERIAVVTWVLTEMEADIDYQMMYGTETKTIADFKLIGCHMKVGFKKAAFEGY